MKKGLFITFEGVDGCGKSTQIKFLAENLREKGIEVLLTREPGGCGISEKIREIILDVGNTEMSAHTEALLYAASRAQHVDEVILPALEAGKIVLCDRFFDSSVAYQGCGRGLGAEYILSINSHSVTSCMPDYTFFMDCTPEDTKLRMKKRAEKDRIENAGNEFFTAVYDGFIELAERYPNRYIHIDASGTKYQTKDIISSEMEEILAKWRKG